MINSMTGYGKKTLNKETRTYFIEMKSVNHRYLDISIKMPKTLGYLEDEIRKEIAKRIKRGKIDVFVTFEDMQVQTNQIKINTEIAKVYVNELKKLAEETGIQSNIEVTEVSKMPDVLTTKNMEENETIKQEVIETAIGAIDNLIQMRKSEGNKIEQDLLSRIEKISQKNQEISDLSTGLIDEYVVKLEGRIKELLKNQEIDESRLAQEVVIYADKCSIEEEVTRLDSHISQFKNFLNSEGAIRKKT